MIDCQSRKRYGRHAKVLVGVTLLGVLCVHLWESLARQNRFQEAIATWREGIEGYQVLGDSDAVAGV